MGFSATFQAGTLHSPASELASLHVSPLFSQVQTTHTERRISLWSFISICGRGSVFGVGGFFPHLTIRHSFWLLCGQQRLIALAAVKSWILITWLMRCQKPQVTTTFFWRKNTEIKCTFKDFMFLHLLFPSSCFSGEFCFQHGQKIIKKSLPQIKLREREHTAFCCCFSL